MAYTQSFGPGEKDRPSNIKASTSTVKGERGALTTTTTIAKSFEGKNPPEGRDLGKDFKPTAEQTRKANLANKQKTPDTTSSNTTVRKSKGVADVANASTRKLSNKTVAPSKKQTREEPVSLLREAAPNLSLKDRSMAAREINNKYGKIAQDPKAVRKQENRKAVKKVVKGISNVFAASPFKQKASSGKGGCFTD
jgi:hypothetical protein